MFGVLREPEAAADGEPFEDDRGVVLLVVALHLDPGDQEEGDLFDRHIRSAAAQPDLTGERSAGKGGAGCRTVSTEGPPTPRAPSNFLNTMSGVHSFIV